MSHIQISEDFIEKMLKTPEVVIEKLNLVYVNNDLLAITRLKEKEGFKYILKGKPYTNLEDLERIEKLVIPPAWKHVKIASIHNGHLQATGKDLKNRKQYRYHSFWKKVRNQTKFYKMGIFGDKLPKIRETVEKDLQLEGWPKRKVLALIIKLMEETHIRIGNEQYAKRNKTYGLSTLRSKHLNIYKDKLEFEFKGKKGKEHKITLRNKKLIKLVCRCEELPGWELFQYYDENGKKNTVDSSEVNAYLHEISACIFTAKDFRTWSASVIFFDTLMDFDPSEDSTQIHKNILKGLDAVAKELGNTRNVCRKYYVHPLLISHYESGLLKDSFKKLKFIDSVSANFSPSEKLVHQIIRTYKPKSLKNL
ncbi:DNA topoisomerase IB [Ascidiimonas sp. W6]|uniref:DNA topoisomerase IB n=1 Tax=Ascidiimonas meishanensis TaxID=3128903 RepID=UPI0030EE4884